MKSLATNWIRRKTDKTLPIPEYLEWPLTQAGGLYYPPNSDSEIFTLKGRPLSMRYGVIVVGINLEDDVKSSIIAHEWRHHMQHYKGLKYEIPAKVKGKSYNQSAKQYFTSSKSEMDALRFQYKHVGFPGVYKPWEELFYDFVKDLHVQPIVSYAD